MAKFIKRDTNIFSTVFLQKFDVRNMTPDTFLVVANNTIALLVKDEEVIGTKRPGTYKIGGSGIDSVFISREFRDYNFAGDSKKPVPLTFPNGEFVLFKYNYFLTLNWKTETDGSLLRITNFNDVTQDDLEKYLEKSVLANLDDIFNGFDPDDLKDNDGNYCNGFLLGEKLSPFFKEVLDSLGLYSRVSFDMIQVNNPEFYDEFEGNDDKKEEEETESGSSFADSFFGNVISDTLKATQDPDNKKSAEDNLDAAILNNLFGNLFGKK